MMDWFGVPGATYSDAAIQDCERYGVTTEADGYEMLARDIIKNAISDYKMLRWREYCWERILQDTKACAEYIKAEEYRSRIEDVRKELLEIDSRAKQTIMDASADHAKYKETYPYMPIYGVNEEECDEIGTTNFVLARNVRKKANQEWAERIKSYRDEYQEKLKSVDELTDKLNDPELRYVISYADTVRYELKRVRGGISRKQQFFRSREFGIYAMADVDGNEVIKKLDIECVGNNKRIMNERVKRGKHPYDFRQDNKHEDDVGNILEVT